MCTFQDKYMKHVWLNSKTKTVSNNFFLSTTIAGMINGGFRESHINSILAALNIPSITQKNTEEEGEGSQTSA